MRLHSVLLRMSRHIGTTVDKNVDVPPSKSVTCVGLLPSSWTIRYSVLFNWLTYVGVGIVFICKCQDVRLPNKTLSRANSEYVLIVGAVRAAANSLGGISNILDGHEWDEIDVHGERSRVVFVSTHTLNQKIHWILLLSPLSSSLD